jgi:hypothetical protein
VPLGFLCAAIFFAFAEPRPRMLAAGGSIALLGLIVRAWSAGHIRKNAELAVSGPYSFTRNPLYFGSFLLGLGFTVAAGRPVLLGGLFAALFLGIYLPVMRVEAATLRELFKEDYERYERAVPLFVPRPTPYRTDAGRRTRFDFALYMRYREYRAAIGLCVALIALALRDYGIGAARAVIESLWR